MKAHAEYGNTTGPIGVPMTDEQAFALESRIKADGLAPTVAKMQIPSAVASMDAAGRWDVSWISTESLDRDKEIVVAAGLDDSHYRLNPIVALNHDYWRPPVGKSEWRKVEAGKGVMAKTVYPSRPEEWSENWPPDECMALLRAGLCMAKSIGYIALKSHAPTDEERQQNPALVNCRKIIDKWLLLEYSCCWLPVQQEAIVTQVSKATLKALGIATEPPPPTTPTPTNPPSQLPDVAFTPLAEIEKALTRRLDAIDIAAMQQEIAANAIATHLGRV